MVSYSNCKVASFVDISPLTSTPANAVSISTDDIIDLSDDKSVASVEFVGTNKDHLLAVKMQQQDEELKEARKRQREKYEASRARSGLATSADSHTTTTTTATKTSLQGNKRLQTTSQKKEMIYLEHFISKTEDTPSHINRSYVFKAKVTIEEKTVTLVWIAIDIATGKIVAVTNGRQQFYTLLRRPNVIGKHSFEKRESDILAGDDIIDDIGLKIKLELSSLAGKLTRGFYAHDPDAVAWARRNHKDAREARRKSVQEDEWDRTVVVGSVDGTNMLALSGEFLRKSKYAVLDSGTETFCLLPSANRAIRRDDSDIGISFSSTLSFDAVISGLPAGDRRNGFGLSRTVFSSLEARNNFLLSFGANGVSFGIRRGHPYHAFASDG